MTAPTNVTNDERMKAVVPERIIIKLKMLNCPLLTNKEDWWIQNILFSRPGHTNEFLQWIQLSFNEDACSEHLPRDDIIKYIMQDSIIEDISQAGKGGDKALNKDNKKYFNSLDKLLDIFLQSQRFKASSPDMNFHERSFSAHLGNKYDDATRLLDEIAEQSVKEDLFPKSVPAFLSEVAAGAITFPNRKSVERRVDNSTAQNCKEIQKKLENVTEEIHLRNETLNILDVVADDFSDCSSSTSIPRTVESELQQLESELHLAQNSLLQLIGEFDVCHEQLIPLLGKQNENVSNLGEKFQMACQKMQLLAKYLDASCAIKDSCSELNSFEKAIEPVANKNLLPGFFGDETEKILLLNKILE